MTQEELDARFQTFPCEGIGYFKAAVLWKVSLKEAILTINDFIKKSKIEYGGTNHNGVFWKPVEVEMGDRRLNRWEEAVCVFCGKKFVKRHYRQVNCSPDCYLGTTAKQKAEKYRSSKK